jgi:hypothetical protein
MQFLLRSRPLIKLVDLPAFALPRLNVMIFLSFPILLLCSLQHPHKVKASLATSTLNSTTPSQIYDSSSSTHRQKEPQKKDWSSWISIDPTETLSYLIKSGLVLSPETRKELDRLALVTSVERAQFNALKRELILHNVVLGPNALQIGRVQVKWDSYLQPSLEIAVSDVSILVEFTNLFLTHSNWNDLHETIGLFPPDLRVVGSAVGEDLMVRFMGVSLRGVTIRISSRPLGRDIGTLRYEHSEQMTNDINARLRVLSDKNLKLTGRRGCTSRELGSVLQEYIGRQVKQVVQEMAANPERTKQQANVLLNTVGDTILTYAKDSSEMKRSELQGVVTDKLEKWGIRDPSGAVDILKKRVRAVKDTNKINIEAKNDKLKRKAMGIIETEHNKAVERNEADKETQFPER